LFLKWIFVQNDKTEIQEIKMTSHKQGGLTNSQMDVSSIHRPSRVT